VTTNWVNWTEVTIAEMQPEFADAFAKSMTDTGELTLSDKVILNAWLATVVGAYQQGIETSELTGSIEDVEEIKSEIIDDIPYLFGNKFSRDWYAANRYWMNEDIIEVIDRELESVPLGADLNYFNSLGN
jgi:hypothetical protein